MAGEGECTTALLIIDVQQELFNKSTPIYRAEQLLSNINTLIERANDVGSPVIFVQHNDRKALAKDTDGWQLHPQLKRPSGCDVVDKQHGNAFDDTVLDTLLKSKGIRRVVVAGLVTHGCVKATCLGAKALSYDVILVQDGHSSYHKDADVLIEEWNQQLSQQAVMIRPVGDITF
jgi:nicotinamidase-related amidase